MLSILMWHCQMKKVIERLQVLYTRCTQRCAQNGSLNHLDEHKQSLEDLKCDFKEYEIKTIRYPDLVERCHRKHVDWQLDQNKIIREVQFPGYDTCSWVNSYFVKQSVLKLELNRIKKMPKKRGNTQMEECLEGTLEDDKAHLSESIESDKVFGFMDILISLGKIVLYLVAGVEDECYNEQTIYYKITEQRGYFKIIRPEKKDAQK